MKGDLISHCHPIIAHTNRGKMVGGVSCAFETEGQTEVDIKLIIEEADGNYSAYSRAYPGCIATGDTIKETKVNMLRALALHIEVGI